MLNTRLDLLNDYPFQRLAELLDGVAPPSGQQTISLAVGEPQHPPPLLIREQVDAHAGQWGKYPPLTGTPDFREAVAAWLRRRYGLAPGLPDPDRHILPACGTREVLFMTALLAVDPAAGKTRPKVVMPNPFYQVYLGGAVIAGAEPVLLPATRETGFLPRLEEVPASVWDDTALFYLCSPANPQGAVADLALLRQAVSLARRHDFLLAIDECYAEIYADKPPPGGLQAAASLDGTFDNVLVFHSLSKRSSAASLRSGFVAGDARAIAGLTRLRSYGGATLPLPISAASAALWREESHVEANRALYRAKFDVAAAILGNRFGFYRPDGGFFLWLEVGDGEEAALKLWRDAGVRVLPGAYLARPDGAGRNPGAPYIRVALVGDLDTTEAALRRLADLL